MIEQGVRATSQRRLVWLVTIIAALMLTATAVLAYRARASNVPGSGNLNKLADIVGNHRLTRARLSGGFAYAPCQSDSSGDRLVHGLVCRSEKPSSWSSAARLSEFAAYMRAHGGAGGADVHANGVWALVWGNVDDAIASLREAGRRNASDAAVLNDLAVALTEKAERDDDPSALIDAFVAADSAVRLDGSLKEAQFTLALLLEQLYLRQDAIDAWNRYLRLDSTSAWAAEARQRLVALQPRMDPWKTAREQLLHAVSISDSQTVHSIVRKHPSDTRAMIQQKLGAWGTAFSGGDTANARAQLDVARALSSPLRAATGDALFVDAVAAIDSAMSHSDADRVRALAKGHAALSRSALALTRVDGRSDLTIAQKLLANGRSPMSRWVQLQEGLSQLALLRQDSAFSAFRAIRDSAPARYLVLRSTAAQYEGFIYDVRSDYVHLLAAYDSAMIDGRTTDDPQIAVRVVSWLAEAEAMLRGREAGWRRRYAALAATPRYPTANTALYTVFDYATLATADEAPRLSFRYNNEVLRVAREASDGARMSYALRRRAQLRARLGQADSARDDIAGALTAARQMSDTAGQAKQIADVLFARAYIDLASAPASAQTVLRQVIDEYKARKYDKNLAMAYLYLAQSRAAAGMIEPARIAFDSATELMQRQRATVNDVAERVRFLDAARDLIDKIVAFHAGDNWRDAFEYFETVRSRVLLEQLEQSRGVRGRASVSVLARLQRSLAKDDIVLSYAVLPRELIVWVIGRNRFEQHRVGVGARELEGLVERFRASVLDGSREPDIGLSQQLYGVLLDSAGPLGRESNLIVIPDRSIHFVPFVALRNPVTGRYLVREYAVRYAPSATLLLASLSENQRRLSRASTVLSIGNPAFNRQAFPLPYLPAADGEARRIASLYSNQTLLTGRDATDAALRRLAPSFDIVHFAGHAIVGREAPQLSHLVLAPDGQSEGVVFSSEIAHWKLARTRLVILSGCSTAGGTLSATEGPSSLARAFFAAGVPEVVSSLWAIDDDETADFFVAFHSRVAQGVPVAAALHETQIKWLGDGPTSRHAVRSWAAFQLFGG